MNRRQKLVQQRFLNNEEAVITALKSTYSQALDDVNERIRKLDLDIDSTKMAIDMWEDYGGGDDEKAQLQSMLQSKIYQKQYQEAIQGQLDDVMDKLHHNSYNTVSGYLKDCYDDGFIGTLYDLQGQGVPLIMPMDQESIVRAVQLDSKISGGLYSRMGEDVAGLKKAIASEVSRGIATGMTYDQVAKQISYKMTGTKYRDGGALARAKTIARTEGHRIQVQAGMDACYKARDMGADVLKQWDATLDDVTRESHQKVDGEVRELDEKFSNGLMFPGDPSGGAAEVVNCRCALLQRARWAMKENIDPDTGEVTWADDSFTKMDGRTGQLVDFSSVEDYNAFKKEYWKAIEATKPNVTLDYDCDIAKKFGSDYYDALHERIANSSNPELAQVWQKYESQIAVGDANYKGHEYCQGSRIYVNGARDAKGNSWQKPYQVTFHESGHAIDSLARSHQSVQNAGVFSRHYSAAYKDGLFPKTIKSEVDDLVKAKDVELKALFKAHKDDVEWLHDNGFISNYSYDYFKRNGTWGFYGEPKYSKSLAYSAIEKEIRTLPTMARADLSDIVEGATKGKIQCGFGHGKTYWTKRTYGGVEDGLATEAFAEMTDSTFANPESLETIKKYLPKSYSVYEEMIKNLL